MTDPRLTKLAKTLVHYSVKVKEGDWVLVYGEVTGLPLLREVIREVLHAGGRPNLLIESDEINEILLNEASEEQIQWISPIENLAYQQIDVLILSLIHI